MDAMQQAYYHGLAATATAAATTARASRGHSEVMQERASKCAPKVLSWSRSDSDQWASRHFMAGR